MRQSASLCLPKDERQKRQKFGIGVRSMATRRISKARTCFERRQCGHVAGEGHRDRMPRARLHARTTKFCALIDDKDRSSADTTGRIHMPLVANHTKN
eukprot:6207694-Pleurochrysis_carterae.AAC.3